MPSESLFVPFAVCAVPVFGPTVLDDTVTPNDSMIADAVEVEGGLAMPGVDSLGPDVQVIRGVGTVYNDFRDTYVHVSGPHNKER